MILCIAISWEVSTFLSSVLLRGVDAMGCGLVTHQLDQACRRLPCSQHFPEKRGTYQSEKLDLTAEHLPLAHRLLPWQRQGTAAASGWAGSLLPSVHPYLSLSVHPPACSPQPHVRPRSREQPFSCPSFSRSSRASQGRCVLSAAAACSRLLGPAPIPGTIPVARMSEPPPPSPPPQLAAVVFWWVAWKDVQCKGIWMRNEN